MLEKTGGDDFKDEVKKLSESHGPLELATGKCLSVIDALSSMIISLCAKI